MNTIVEEHVKEVQKKTHGWGTGTRLSIERLAKGKTQIH